MGCVEEAESKRWVDQLDPSIASTGAQMAGVWNQMFMHRRRHEMNMEFNLEIHLKYLERRRSLLGCLEITMTENCSSSFACCVDSARA
jgi:hypothetical protein